ncbi:30S ribosomal protein S17 [Pelagicoccus sp. SDUM812005]|uniref:30S ribosomal protein S17 n=1 Tax=Pelagicoccus sp. SDUM812005 TaxID=3041257 RepID=UPI0031BB417D
MENSRNKRKDLQGVVTSIMGDKSIKVTYSYKKAHPRYRKVINRKTVVHVHDEENTARLGDKVEIMETRPLSRLKRWRLVKVTERAPMLGKKTLAEVEAEQEAHQAESGVEA